MTDPRPIFLVGFMGSGKTTIAARLAAALGWEALGTDEWIAGRAGRSVEAIFRESGEVHFRRLEREALEALDGRERCVVAAGGGIFCDPANRRWMKARGRTVWLDAPLEVCAARVGEGHDRPLWDATDRLALRAFFERRRASYALAEVRVFAGDPDPRTTLGLLLAALAGAGPADFR